MSPFLPTHYDLFCLLQVQLTMILDSFKLSICDHTVFANKIFEYTNKNTQSTLYQQVLLRSSLSIGTVEHHARVMWNYSSVAKADYTSCAHLIK